MTLNLITGGKKLVTCWRLKSVNWVWRTSKMPVNFRLHTHICNWKREFSSKSVGFNHGNYKDFEGSQWPIFNNYMFVTYRCLMALYHVTIIILTGSHPHKEWLSENTAKYR